MGRITLRQIEKAKESHCKEEPGSYNFLRNLCKRYIEQQTNKAPYGQKTKAKKSASIAATEIVKGTCYYAAGRIFYQPSVQKQKKSKAKMKNKNTGWLIFGGLAVVGVGLAVFLNRDKQTSAQKRTALINWFVANEPGEEAIQKLSIMTDREIESVYDAFFNYFLQNKKLPEGSRLYNEIQVISAKYDIFN